MPEKDKPFTPFCLTLASTEAMLELVGGKGASLARMSAAGLPVPPGFHVTTASYRAFVDANGIQVEIEREAAGANLKDPISLERASAAIRRVFESGVIPEEVSVAISRAYFELGGNDAAVAVRSSATAEDLPGMSFAGQQESYLNVRGADEVLDAVRRCWASLWTSRAIAYRAQMGVDESTVTMGVVVQQLIDSETSGVAFTANPTTGERGEIVINASFGLGEAVVSGQVTPDAWVVHKATQDIKERVLGGKEVEVRPSGSLGTTTTEIPAERRAVSSLSDEQVRELARLAARLEALYEGTPQDVEWAWTESGFAILQARPMTALPPAPLDDVRWEPPILGSAWIRRQVVENMPEPLSPLFDELYLGGLDRAAEEMQAAMGVPRSMMDSLFDRPMFATVNGYAYMRGNMKLRWWSVPVLVPMVLGAMAAGVTKLLRNAGIRYWRDDVMPRYLATVERWKAIDPRTASEVQILGGLREMAQADALYWFAVALAMGTAKSTDSMLDSFLNVAVRRRGLTSGLFLRGFPSRVLDAEAELERIASEIRDSPVLRPLVETTPARNLHEALEMEPAGQRVRELLRDYLDRYGHQIYSLDFAVPTQAEDPTPVLMTLKALVSSPGRSVRDRQAKLVQERDRLSASTARSLDPVRRAMFRKLLRSAQGFGPYREEALFHMGAAWPALRRLALELGRRLTESGSLEAPGDVFYLHTRELAAASDARAGGRARTDLASLARGRRELREARKRLHPPAAVPVDFQWKLGPIALSSRESQRRDASTGPTMRGFAVSPGRVSAPASVILSPADFERMVPDTVLVCPTTTPAWTPLFAQAKGLVTDIGGVAAHGSIVAREYGIPAVMGTGNGTQRIVSGQAVTVDGDAGTVTIG